MRPGQDVTTLIVEAVVLGATVTVVPWGLARLTSLAGEDASDPLLRVVRPLLRVAPLAAGLGLALPHGPFALLLVVPWIATTALIALSGARRFVTRERRTIATTAGDLARAYVPVGAAWLGAYAGDLQVMQFHGLQCLLTAAHFHYAGFGACTVTALVGHSLDDTPTPAWVRTLYSVAAVGMMAGIALLAAGITASRTLEHLAGWEVAACTAIMGALLLRRATLPARPLARGLFALSGAATALSSALAFDFARSGFARLGAHTLERMVRYHGLVNALGFVGCALVAFTLAPPGENPSLSAPRASTPPPRPPP